MQTSPRMAAATKSRPVSVVPTAKTCHRAMGRMTIASRVHSTVTMVVLSSSVVRVLTSSWKKAYNTPPVSPRATPIAENVAPLPSRDGTMITASPPSATPRRDTPPAPSGPEQARRQQRDPDRLHEEEEGGDGDAGVADGEEVAEQGAGVERAHEQELGPEVPPEEHAERPPAREQQGQDHGGEDEPHDEQHAGRGVRPADERAAEPDEDEAAGDKTVAGEVAPGFRAADGSRAHPSGSSSGSPRAYSTTRIPAATISAPPATVQPLGRWPSRISA